MIYPPSPRELLRTQLTLQCTGVEAGNRLVRIPGPDPDGIPRYYVARFPDGTHETFFSAELPDFLLERLAALTPHVAFENPATIERILADDVPCEGIWMGTSYTFPEVPVPSSVPTRSPNVVRLMAAEHGALVAQYDPELVLDGRAAFAILRDGRIVASCVSSRENATAGEAWVHTEETYRGRGYARLVTAAWGAALRQAGKTAFYSHHADNTASTGVARSLGLRPFVCDAGYL